MSATTTMFRVPRALALALVAAVSLATIAAAQSAAAPAAGAADSVAYDAIPATLPTNVASLGYAATRTSELGDRVVLGSTSGALSRVEVGFSSWACETGAWNTGDCVTTPGATFTHPVTVTLYAVGDAGAVGAPLATATETVVAPYRPSGDAVACDGKKWWDGSACVSGVLFTHSFAFTGAVTLPGEIIVGVAFDTRTAGAHPLGTAGPADALNVAVEGSATVGADADVDGVYLNSSVAGSYGSSGATGVFRPDTGWAPYGTLMLAIVLDAPSAAEPPASQPPVPASADAAIAASAQELPASVVDSGTTGDDRTLTLQLGAAFANQWVYVTIYSTPTPVGWVWVGPSGAATFTVPASLPGGVHTIALLDGSGNVLAHVAGVTVAAILADTGVAEAELILLLALGIALVLLGLVGVLSSRRRHAAHL